MSIELKLEPRLMLRWILGLVMVWASLSKLANLQDFYANLLAYELGFPDALLRVVAITLPWLELLCGLALLGNARTEAALIWCLLLFAMFTLATGLAWARGLEISCGCLNLGLLGLSRGNGSGAARFLESVAFVFFRALLLALAAAYLWRHARRNRALIAPPD